MSLKPKDIGDEKISCYCWKNLPALIFSDIMMILGRNNHEELKKCRQVSQRWNVKISQMTKSKKDTIIGKAKSLAAKIKEKWIFSSAGDIIPLPDIVTAASLAHHGLLGSVESMTLEDVDLSSVPAEHLASLSSCVMSKVNIINVNTSDLISMLDSIDDIWLFAIGRQSLGSEETRALVRAMETRVESVILGGSGKVSLDIGALTQYSGQGMCSVMECFGEFVVRYANELISWADNANVNWDWDEDEDSLEELELVWLKLDRFYWPQGGRPVQEELHESV